MTSDKQQQTLAWRNTEVVVDLKRERYTMIEMQAKYKQEIIVVHCT